MEDYKKKYENVVEKLREALAPVEILGLTRGYIEELFPEIKPTEEDVQFAVLESIIKRYIDYVKDEPTEHRGKDFLIHRAEKCFEYMKTLRHDGKKWIYADVYEKEKDEMFKEGVDSVLENPANFGLKYIDAVNLGELSKREVPEEGDIEPIFKVDDVVYHKDNEIKFLSGKDVARITSVCRGHNGALVYEFDDTSWITVKTGNRVLEKVKYKFKVGDVIAYDINTECTVKAISDGRYLLEDGGFLNVEDQDLWHVV